MNQEKIKLLWHSDSSVASHTGFGRVSYEILSRLSKYPQFTIAELGSGNIEGKNYKAQPNWKIYLSGKSTVGEDKFLPTVLDFKPDVVVSLMDIHMNAFINDYNKVPLEVRNSFRAITHVPVDGQPIPPSWVNTMVGWNKIVPIHWWGENVIKKSANKQFRRLLNICEELKKKESTPQVMQELQLNSVYLGALLGVIENTKTIPHGVDLTTYHPAENKQELRKKYGIQDEFVFCHVGRNSPRKMTVTLLEAFKEVNSKHPNTKLILGCKLQDVGWDLTDALVELEINPASLIVTDNSSEVCSEGLTDQQIAELYQISDCFVSPCYGGGFELAHLESMACGLPQIGVKDAGSIDTMVEGHGILVPAKRWNLGGQFGPYDRPIVEAHPFALAMIKMMQDKKKRELWSAEAYKYATSDVFNWDKIVEQFAAVIEEVMLDDSVAIEGVVNE